MATSNYCCKCTVCKGDKYVCYSTIRRHYSLYGCTPSQYGSMDEDDDGGDGGDDEYDGDDNSDDNGDDNSASDNDNGSDDGDGDDSDGEYNGDDDGDDSGDGEDNSDDGDDSGDEDNDIDGTALMSLILTILFKVQQVYNLSNKAITGILVFISFLLSVLAHPLHMVFPRTLHSAIKVSGVDTVIDKVRYDVCPKENCNALYEASEHLEHCTMTSFGRVCGAKLGYERHLSSRKRVWKAFKCFQFIPPSAWLKKMLARTEFDKLIEHCRVREPKSRILEDIYDGRVWKDFVAGGFSGKYDIAFMLNVDWYKPFKRSEYKVAALMLTVLNLPREERFKKKWTIIAGIIPGPREPEGNINTYLKPLVDDLNKLFTGIALLQGSSQLVRAALFAVATDMPAIRKVTQFLGHKANFGCARCKFTAEREPGTSGASGKMSYFTTRTSESRNHEEVVEQAEEFRRAVSKTDAALIARRNGVRYSELIRLPYFDMVRMVSVDPMHTFMLGMVRKEIELIMEAMTPERKQKFLHRVKSIKLPYDIGRLPSNVFDNDVGLGSVTAQQWKNFIVTFARPCFYKLLSDRCYKSVVLLSQIVMLIISPVLILDDIAFLYDLLQEHHKLFCQLYGKWSVSVNYHMALHLPDIILDLGPPQAFWCFAYERMNGILAGTPNSNRCIELEVLNRYLRDFAFSSTPLDTRHVPANLREHLMLTPDDPDILSYPQMFWVLSLLNTAPERRFYYQQQVDKGEVNDWPMVFQHPRLQNMKTNQAFLQDLKTFLGGLYGSDLTYVRPRINKYGRCSVNGMKFSSDFNSTERGSIVKCVFVDTANVLTPYFGIVKYYFTVAIVLGQQCRTLHLAYVTWLKFRTSSPEPLSKLYIVTKELYQGDRIVSPRRFLGRCILVTPNPAVNQSLVSELHK